MKELILSENFSWGMVIFFVLLVYIIVSIIEYIKGSHHRRLGYWFSKVKHDGSKRFTSRPVSLKGHLFLAVSIVLGVLIIAFIDDIRIEIGLLAVWILLSLITTHKKSAR